LQSLDSIAPLAPGDFPVAFALLAWNTPDGQVPNLSARLALTKRQREAVLALPSVRALRPRLVDGLEPSAVDEMLSPHPWAAVIALGAAEDTAASWWAREYIGKMRGVTTTLTGDDLQAMGVPPGPQLGQVLKVLRKARLDGVIQTREHEENAVRQLIAAASENGRSA
jgi:tRNA nucleotidyltransferase (CCA-adding enzyme)